MQKKATFPCKVFNASSLEFKGSEKDKNAEVAKYIDYGTISLFPPFKITKTSIRSIMFISKRRFLFLPWRLLDYRIITFWDTKFITRTRNYWGGPGGLISVNKVRRLRKSADFMFAGNKLHLDNLCAH
jgi:hypothetical protein